MQLMVWRSLTMTGLFGLIGLIIIWNGWLTPVQALPRSLEVLLLITPLLIPLGGILSGRIREHVHATLYALLYVTLGIWHSFLPQEEVYGYLIVLFSIALYAGGFMTARTLGKATSEHTSSQVHRKNETD